MNVGASSLAQCFNMAVETLSEPAAFLLLLKSFLTSCSCTVKGVAQKGRAACPSNSDDQDGRRSF